MSLILTSSPSASLYNCFSTTLGFQMRRLLQSIWWQGKRRGVLMAYSGIPVCLLCEAAALRTTTKIAMLRLLALGRTMHWLRTYFLP